MWMVSAVSAIILGVTSPRPLHAADKVDICHFQSGKGSWKLLSVGQPSAVAHLEHHDDAIPGGTTAQTGTVLDAECVEVTCPCGDASNIVSLYNMFEFDGPQVINTGVEPDVVFYNARDGLEGSQNPQLVLNANTSLGNNAPLCIYLMTNEIGAFVIEEEHFNISVEEAERCREDIIAVIDRNTNEQP